MDFSGLKNILNGVTDFNGRYLNMKKFIIFDTAYYNTLMNILTQWTIESIQHPAPTNLSVKDNSSRTNCHSLLLHCGYDS